MEIQVRSCSESEQEKNRGLMIDLIAYTAAFLAAAVPFSRVDDPMNRALIDAVVDYENIRASSFAPDHWAGAHITYNAADNTEVDILSGKITFRQKIAPYTPAQEINNILSYDIEMLKAALGGE